MPELSPASIYRVDRFVVPETARNTFLERILIIRDFLETQPGCLFNRIAESRNEDETLSMMTIVEWRDRQAMAAAREKAKAFYEETGFAPKAFMAELGIEPDFGLFEDIPPEATMRGIA